MGCLGFFVVPPKNAAVFTESSKKSSRWKTYRSLSDLNSLTKIRQMNGNPRLVGLWYLTVCQLVMTLAFTRGDVSPYWFGYTVVPVQYVWQRSTRLARKHIKENNYVSLDIHLSIVFRVHLDMICPKGDFPTVLGWNQFYLRVKHPENEAKLSKRKMLFLSLFFQVICPSDQLTQQTVFFSAFSQAKGLQCLQSHFSDLAEAWQKSGFPGILHALP